MTNEIIGEWKGINFSEWSNTKKITISMLISIVPAFFLITIIHEFGHMLFCWLFGWDIVEFSFLPTSFRIGGYVKYLVDANPTDFEYFMVFIGGSLLTLIVSYFFFLLFYKYDLPLFLESLFFVFSIMFGLDMLIYLVGDIFVMMDGDWYNAFNISSIGVLIFLVVSILNLIFFVRYFDLILERIDGEWSMTDDSILLNKEKCWIENGKRVCSPSDV